jgi:hypothetical protein
MKTTSKNDKKPVMKMIGLKFDERDLKALKIEAAQNNTTISDILRTLIKEYLA